jgi:hypothetical protein
MPSQYWKTTTKAAVPTAKYICDHFFRGEVAGSTSMTKVKKSSGEEVRERMNILPAVENSETVPIHTPAASMKSI